MIKYSFIMPVYNASETLKKSIESIIAQTYDNWELIVVDDGSTDESYEKLKKYSKLDERIKSYTKKNSGPGKTRNFAIEKTSGDYIIFIDSDDYYEKDLLESINVLIEESNYDLIFINTINEQKDGKIDYIDNIHKYNKLSKNELIKIQMTGKLPWGPCSKIVKSDIVKKCFFSDIKVGEEAIYSFDILNYTNTWFFLEKPMYHYVHNDSGQHKKGGVDPWKNVVNNLKQHLIEKEMLETYEDSLNSLAINSMLVAVYRISNSYSYFKSRNELKKITRDYSINYNLDKADLKLLSFSSKILYIFIKLKCWALLIILSKIRKKIYK